MVEEKQSQLVILCAVVVAFLLYSKIVPLPESSFDPAVDEKQIHLVSGKVVSNPVKSSEKYYSVKIDVDYAQARDKSVFYSGGIATVLMETSLVEALYPDRLYSRIEKKTSHAYLIERGAKIKFNLNYIKTDEKVFLICTDLISCSFDENFSGRFERMRALCRIQFKRLMSAWGKAGGLVLALLSGSKEYLDQSMNTLFKMSGLSHILALSGMHLSIISGFTGLFVSKSLLKKLWTVMQLILIFIFVWFAGLSASLLRALISCVILTLCKLFNIRERSGIYVLCLTFLVHVAVRAQDVFAVSFLLSYGALCGILLISPALNKIFSGFVSDRICSSLTSSVGAVSFTAPVSLRLFGFISPAGIVSTMFVSPLITAFLYLSIVFMGLSFIFPFSVKIAAFVMNFIYEVIKSVVSFWNFIPVIQF
ncbi:ComEC/Rec2 family competence protein [Treponema sp.]|uniref:ComEC/Rec2 family competence protein n=1 Tax=Treponema sp. TaxID=166 RepID=UPI00388F76C6